MYIYHIDEDATGFKSSLAADLKWTTEPPKEDGYYFASGPEIEGATMVEITEGELYISGWEGYVDPKHYTFWLGPLPEPEPPITKEQE